MLLDKSTGRSNNNESAGIIRLLGDRFTPGRLYNQDNTKSVQPWNALIYPSYINDVYRSGFARTQAAHNEAVTDVFATLDRIETRLAQTCFLAGDAISEADIRLFPTLVRFDVAYHSAIKNN